MQEITKELPLSSYFSPWRSLGGLWKSRELTGQLARRNVETRYKGSILGLIWLAATPLVMLAVYTFVFGLVFKSRWGSEFGDSKAAFALIMFCGMTVFNVFSESVNGAVGVITGNPNYVKKVVFPLETLPVASVLSACFFGLVWLGILLIGIGLFLHKFCLTAICLPLVFIPLALLSCGVAWFVASLGVFVRDLPHVVGIVLQVLIFLTPVFYSPAMVPSWFKPWLLMNPLNAIVQSARDILIFGRWPDWAALGAVTAISFVVFQAGYVWFMKTRRGFADVL